MGEIAQSMKPTIVIASGFFNPIHSGHIYYLRAARTLGDKLYVIVNNDEQVIRKKYGIIVPQDERYATISELRCVDLAWVSRDKDDTVIETLRQLCENDRRYYNFIFANGGDVKSCREQKVCDELGIKTVFGVGGYNKSISSSDIIRNAYLAYAKSINCGDG